MPTPYRRKHIHTDDELVDEDEQPVATARVNAGARILTDLAWEEVI